MPYDGSARGCGESLGEPRKGDWRQRGSLLIMRKSDGDITRSDLRWQSGGFGSLEETVWQQDR
jgi:hypothetical protein